MASRAGAMSWDPDQNTYPAARRDEEHIELFKSAAHGNISVPDPYIWLENPDSDETRAFVRSQADFTEAYLKRCEPVRTKFKESLTKTQDFPRFSVPSLKDDGHYYFSFNTGLQAQSAIYRIKRGEESRGHVEANACGPGGQLFFDTNLLSVDGTVALQSTAFSRDGRYFAYAVSKSGSDWSTIYVRETSSPHKRDQRPGTDDGRLADRVGDVKFSGSALYSLMSFIYENPEDNAVTWTPDSKGFLYNRFPSSKVGDEGDQQGTETDQNVDAELYYHRLGTDQKDDLLIMRRDVPRSTWMWATSVSEECAKKWHVHLLDTGKNTLLWVADIARHPVDGKLPWLKIVNEWGADYGVIGNDGTRHYLTTNKDAPRERIVTIDLEEHGKGFEEYLAEDAAVLKDAHMTGNNLILLYSRNVRDELLLYDLQRRQKVAQIGEGMVGVISTITGKRSHGEFWFSFNDFTNPMTVYRYQVGHEKALSVYRSTIVTGIDPDDYRSEQVFFESKDGTRVPMFIVSRKDAKYDGSMPAILYGYGGFSISIEPFFSPAMMTFIRHFHGVLAVANIRGGGEYGEDWHLAGCFEKKQNVFDDFQCAAKYLKAHEIAKEVIISGGSNGGLLVGACVNQAPDLFAAGVADVGVMDMLKFDRFTIGRAWTADYGHPDTPEGFDYLFKYSPLHNVIGGCTYPPMMLLTGDHDDRVVPLHSFKMAATLQHELAKNPNPLLLRLDLKSGHGAGKSTEKRIIEAADKWSFVATACGLRWHD